MNAAELERAGFVNRGGKGSHEPFVHPKVTKPVILSREPGEGVKRYQVRAVQLAVAEAIELYAKDGKPLSLPTSGRDFATKMQHVA